MIKIVGIGNPSGFDNNVNKEKPASGFLFVYYLITLPCSPSALILLHCGFPKIINVPQSTV